LTLRSEIEVIWGWRWTYTTALFILSRYLPMVNAYLFLHSEHLSLGFLLSNYENLKISCC
jgi:hypothetical protein